jgi:TPR repeat protein
MFENGRGVAKDDAEAVRLYRLAAAQGDADAIAALKRLGA